VRFRLEQSLPGSFDEVIGALLDPAFIASRGELPNLGPPEVLDQVRDEAAGTVQQRVRYRFTGSLSSAVTRVVDPAKLTWVDETTYRLAERLATFRVIPDHYAGKLRCEGTHVFVDDGAGGTTRSVDADLSVKVPIVGRAVEKAIVSGLRGHLDAEGAHLREWLRIR
jgi:hypothetical protein